MPYIRLSDSSYPVYERDIRYAFPNTSFTDPFTAPEGYAWVFPSPLPAYSVLAQRVTEIAPVLVGGQWFQQWSVVDLDQATIDANSAAAQAALQVSIVAATQQRLDEFARTRNYDGILSACTYATSPTPRFAADGQYCVARRDATWATLYAILAAVQAGTRPAPSSFADIESDLPALEWPA